MKLSIVLVLAPYGSWGAGAHGFLSALHDGDGEVREAAAELVGECARVNQLPLSDAVGALQRAAASDEDPRVRTAARFALAKLAC